MGRDKWHIFGNSMHNCEIKSYEPQSHKIYICSASIKDYVLIVARTTNYSNSIT